MAWFRTNRGLSRWLALFALACQFAFSFGHLHLDKFSAGLVPAQSAVQTNGTSADAPPPSPQKDPAATGDFCAICANISLAFALILPILALLLAHDRSAQVLRWLRRADVPAAFDHLPFGARGPPHHA